MNKVLINGKFMSQRMMGLTRYARELLNAVDSIFDKKEIDFTLIVPENVKDVPDYKSIKTIFYGKHNGTLWEQTDLRKFVKKHKDYLLLNLCNIAPVFVRPGVTAILDIMYKVNPKDYSSIRNRISRMWHCFQYKMLTKREKAIITISDFCKKEIAQNYPKAHGKIEVIPCAWQHVLRYKESENWNSKYSYLKTGEFYFSLSTLAKNKNGKWILEIAKKNPNSIFVMGGKIYETEYKDIPSNVRLIGFISDEEACSLIKNCKAFLFPSFYEGFGIPPLEALALGANIIISDRASLPEVFMDSAHYIDPLCYDYDMDKILNDEIADSKLVLDKYSWNNSAEKLISLLKRIDI